VIRWLRMIALRAWVPTTRIRINDQGRARQSVVTAVVAVSAALPGTTHAADPVVSYYSCNTTGATGFLAASISQNLGADNTWNIHLEITVTLPDGHHAQVRLVTEDASGTTRYWAWYSNTSGVGTIVVDNDGPRLRPRHHRTGDRDCEG
jgi:hypothetical protein